MQRSEWLTAFERDARGFVDACRRAGPEAAVPACPGWAVDDLARHLLDVFHRWVVRVRLRPADPGRIPPLEVPAEGLLAAVEREAAELLAALAATDDADEVWTFTVDHTAGFVVRRAAHETAVHRWDAEQAAGDDAATVEPTLASDGVDEYLTWFLAPAEGAPPVGGTVHLHCTDVAGEWMVRWPDGHAVVTREHAKGDTAIRGAASDLLLVLWKRQPLDTVEVIGDDRVAERFLAWSAAR